MAFRKSVNSRIWSEDLVFCKNTSDVGLGAGEVGALFGVF